MRRKIMAALASVILTSGGVWFWRVRRDPLPGGMSPTWFVQLPHDVNVLAFSDGGRLLMASDGSENGTVTFLDAPSGFVLCRWTGGGENIWLSADGQRALTMSYDLRTKTFHYVLHDALSGAVMRDWTDKGRVETMAVNLSLLVVIERGKVQPYRGRLIEVSSGRERGKFEVPEVSWGSVRLSRDLRTLSVSGAQKSPALLLSTADLRPLLELPPLQSVSMSQDKKRVIGIDAQGTIHFWQLPWQQHSTVATGLDRANWMYQTRDGNLVLDGSRENKPPAGQKVQSSSSALQVRSADGTKLLQELPVNATKAFSSGGRLVGSQAPRQSSSPSENFSVYDIYDVNSLQRSLRIDARFDALGQTAATDFYSHETLSISADGRRIACAGRGGLLRVYDADKGGGGYRSDMVSTLGGRTVVSFNGDLRDVVVLPDGGVAALGTNDINRGESSVQVAQPKSGVRTYDDKEVAGAIVKFGLSREGRNLNAAHLSNYGERQQERTYQGATFLLASKTVSPDGNTALVLWNRATKNKDKSWSVAGKGLIELRATNDDRVLHRLEIVRSNS